MVEQQHISVGKISGVFGVKGGIKIFSFTDPRENVLTYSPWMLKKGNEVKEVKLQNGQRQGKSIVASLEGITDRDQAAELIGWEILIDKHQLPKADAGEYYWRDLIGLNVVTQQGVELGIVKSMMETGANDVLVVLGDRERLIPYVQEQVIVNVDLKEQKITVDWDSEF